MKKGRHSLYEKKSQSNRGIGVAINENVLYSARGGDTMNASDAFQEQLQLLMRAQKENIQNPLLCHGIVHIFMDTFDAGQDALREYMRQHQLKEVARGTPKELLMEAYERILSVQEETWLHMLQDRYHPENTERIQHKARRVLNEYIPAFVELQKFIVSQKK